MPCKSALFNILDLLWYLSYNSLIIIGVSWCYLGFGVRQ